MPEPVGRTSTTTIQSDTNDIKIDLPDFSIEKENIPTQIIYRNTTDSNYVHLLLKKIDSLRQFVKNDVKIVYKLDTIHEKTKDTIHVECEEMKRSIMFSLKPSPRYIQTITNTITNTIETTVTKRYGFGVNVGVAYTTKEEIVPAVSVGFNYIFY